MTFLVNNSGKIVKASQNKYKIFLSSIFVSKSGEDTKAKEVLIQCCTPQSKSSYKPYSCQVY